MRRDCVEGEHWGDEEERGRDEEHGRDEEECGRGECVRKGGRHFLLQRRL